MEQRPLRLGDILDDYCPRERRLTNHVVVAIVEDTVKQTRCSTCDAEHAYKGGRAPRRRRKDATSALYNEVLAGLSDAPDTSPQPGGSKPVALAVPVDPDTANGNGHEPDEPRVVVSAPEPTPIDEVGDDPGRTDDGPIHRRLIRATLPRPEGQKDVRQAPDFTMRGPTANRGGHGSFRGDRMRGPGSNGNHGRGAGRRFGAGEAGGGRGGRGGRPGFGGGNQHRQGGGRKRSR